MKDIKIQYKHLQLELDNYCRDVERIYKNKLANGGKIASGNLVNNFEVKAALFDNNIVVSINTLEYFKYVEEGRSPGKFPPPDSIERWIETKGIEPKADENGKLPSQKSLAYLIGRKIATEGIEPTHYLAETQQELDQIYAKRFKQALQLDFNDYSSQLASEIHNMLNV